MRIDKDPVHRIRIMVHEVAENKMVPGSSRSMALYDTTPDEVFKIIEDAIKAHLSKLNQEVR